MELLNTLVSAVNNVLWSYVLIVMLVGLGLWFSFRTGFVQIRHLREMVRLVAEGATAKTKKGHISTFQAFCVSTASRVGVGNIAGIAIAVVVGGPAYYIGNALGSRWGAWLFSVLISVTYGLIFNSVQANTMALSLKASFDVDPAWTGLGIAVLTGLVIFGGLNRIARVVGWMVPLMAGAYLLLAAVVTVMNITLVPEVLLLIVKSAFGVDAVTGAAFGMALMTGIKRGLFSNEAGMGSVPNAAATADASHPVKQGLVQALGVFVDTMFVCTASAMIVLLSPDWHGAQLTGIELTQHVLTGQLGAWTNTFMTVIVLFFAFSSIIGNYFYGEVNMDFISRRPIASWIFRGCVLVMVYFGSVASLNIVWNLADLFMALMAMLNLAAIALLGRYAFAAMKDYFKQRSEGGENPEFDPSVLPATRGIVCWPRKKDEEVN